LGLAGSDAVASGTVPFALRSSWATDELIRKVWFSANQAAMPPPIKALAAQQRISFFISHRFGVRLSGRSAKLAPFGCRKKKALWRLEKPPVRQYFHTISRSRSFANIRPRPWWKPRIFRRG